MKLKLAIIYGVLIWIFLNIGTYILNPFFTKSFPEVNIIVPILSIILIGFFGILYIRNINENEVIEGFMFGVIFIIIDTILDNIFLIGTSYRNLVFMNYSLHITSTIVLTLLITTFLGYLAQMSIDLK